MHLDGAVYLAALKSAPWRSVIIQWRITMRWLSMIAAMITVATSLAASQACAQTCQQLWVERNQYYKNHGYCFKTQRAIEFFRQWGLLHQR